MITHDFRNDGLSVVVNLNKHRLFAPCEQFIVFLFEFVMNFDRSLKPPFLNQRVKAFPYEAEVLRVVDSSPRMHERTAGRARHKLKTSKISNI
jgi:hypothetical protein